MDKNEYLLIYVIKMFRLQIHNSTNCLQTTIDNNYELRNIRTYAHTIK